jgi:glycosyltransferase involved in cell wall biosynthesis
VVVPVFNGARDILDNLRLLISELEPHFEQYEVIVVSDGSTDGTNDVLAAFEHPKVQRVLQERNRGKGAAVREGFARARHDYLFFIDGGMEIHPRELRFMLALMALYEADIVIGSKRHPQSQVFYPWYRKALSVTYQLLIRGLFDVRATDTQVGMKLFRREVIQAILPDLRIERYGFDVELLTLARLRGYDKVLEAPVRLDYFSRGERGAARDLLHVLHVGGSILGDTVRLYLRLKSLR